EVPPRAAEFAVGDRLKADILLLLDDALDLAVLDLLQRLLAQLALSMLGPRVVDRLRTKQAADMVGAERRLISFHVFTPGIRKSVSGPRLRRRSPQSCGASPTALPRRGHCPPRSRQSRTAATGRADRAARTSRPDRSGA